MVEITAFRLERKYCKGFFLNKFSNNDSTRIITGHVIYNPAHTYKFQLKTTKDQWCVDLDQMHMSGISNGGMLLWNIAAQVPDGFGFATFNTIAASPQLGFALPTFANWQQFSFIDMHGLEDITIPTNLNSAYGPSPYDGLMSKHGSYFEDKEKYLKKWSDAMKCSEEEIFYETPYDGQNDFYCLERKCPEQVRQ